MSEQKYDVIIVGAGLIGSSLALALAADTNLSIALIERASPLTENLQPNTRVVALGHIASDLLEQFAVLEKLGSEHCHSYKQMFVWDENSTGELRFNASEHRQPRLGYMVDSIRCAWLLQQTVESNPQVEAHYDTVLESLEFNSGSASLLVSESEAGEHRFSAPLIIAADGANSWLRQQAKIFANHRDYQQQGIVTRIHTSESHGDTAWQRFLSSGPLAILPLADNQSSVVWSADDEQAAELMALSDAEFERALAQALEGRLGDVRLQIPRQSFPLRSLKAESYFKRHIALVGDAAHSIHPLAGQGANLGFKDVACLSGLIKSAITNAAPKSELGGLSLLQQYQRQRKADNEQTDVLMSALHGAYQSELPLWMLARGVGMNWISNTPGVKRALVRQAMGY